MAADAVSSRWIELSLTAELEAVDAVAEIFTGCGTSGVAIEPQIELGPDGASRVLDGPSRITAYLPLDSSAQESLRRIEERLWHLTAFDLGHVSPVVSRSVIDEDWANAWKEHFHTLRLGRRMLVKPTWRVARPRPGDVLIELDPGMAFGTGLHPTTRMTAEALEGELRPGDRVLDLGTGSGILAVAAAKLGAGEVVAVDNDELSCRVAAQSVRQNGVGKRVSVRRGSIESADGVFDLIVVNIVATVIAQLAPELHDRMEKGSRLVASGIINERSSLVLEAFAGAGLAVSRTMRSGDWLCYVASSRAKG